VLGRAATEVSPNAVLHLLTRLRRDKLLKTFPHHFHPRIASEVFRSTIHGNDFSFEIMQENHIICVLKELAVAFFAAAQRFFGRMPRCLVVYHDDPCSDTAQFKGEEDDVYKKFLLGSCAMTKGADRVHGPAQFTQQVSLATIRSRREQIEQI